ncbi:hypothetical protein QVA66_02310 [Staphylococcus chromogenes]|nr:hypothetical protein [Staphylococcus chromogenes]
MSITTPPRNIDRRSHTALLERPSRARRASQLDAAGTTAIPRRERVGAQPLTRQPRRAESFLKPNHKNLFQKKLGSKQVVSVRGRRVEQQKADPAKVKLIVGVMCSLVAAIAIAVLLSGRTTEQAFELQKLNAQETQLNNQLETLNRDVEAARASAEMARKASEGRMVVPDQPGILAVENNGAVTEQRPSKPEATRPIIDVNGAQVRADVASSDPKDTKEVTNNVNSIPQPQSPGVAPYQPRTNQQQASGMGQGAR